MDAVGNMADGDFIDFFAGIERLPHLAADAPMEFTHAVRCARGLQGEHGHAEWFIRALWIHPAHAHQFILRDAKLCSIGAERVFHQGGTKAVVACFHGGVGGEDALVAGGGQGFVEAFTLGQPFAGEFQR